MYIDLSTSLRRRVTGRSKPSRTASKTVCASRASRTCSRLCVGRCMKRTGEGGCRKRPACWYDPFKRRGIAPPWLGKIVLREMNHSLLSERCGLGSDKEAFSTTPFQRVAGNGAEILPCVGLLISVHSVLTNQTCFLRSGRSPKPTQVHVASSIPASCYPKQAITVKSSLTGFGRCLAAAEAGSFSSEAKASYLYAPFIQGGSVLRGSLRLTRVSDQRLRYSLPREQCSETPSLFLPSVSCKVIHARLRADVLYVTQEQWPRILPIRASGVAI